MASHRLPNNFRNSNTKINPNNAISWKPMESKAVFTDFNSALLPINKESINTLLH